MGWSTGESVPDKRNRYFSSSDVQTSSGDHSDTQSACTGVISPSAKRQECEVDYSPPSNLVVKNQCSLTLFPYMPSRSSQGQLYFYPSIHAYVFRVVSFFQVFQPKPFMSLSRKPHAPPISSFPI